MTTLTNIRAGRVAAIFAAFQSAKGSAVSAFTTLHRLWSYDAAIDIKSPIVSDWGMDTDKGPRSSGSWNHPDALRGSMRVMATPASVETLLKSNWGTVSGGTFTLKPQIGDTRFLTLALSENVVAATGKAVRLRDAWFHSLALHADPDAGLLMLEGEYAARKQLNEALGGGVTFPSSPAQPADKDVYPFANVTLKRDPAGANVSIRFDRLLLTLEQGLIHEYSMATGLFEVYKRGPTRAILQLESAVADETWTMLSNSLAGTKQRYRITAVTDDATPTTLTIDLYEVHFEVGPLGHIGRSARPFIAIGEAKVDGSSNFVTITQT